MKLILTMFLALLAGPSFGAATDFVPSEIWQKITNLNAMKAFFSENLSESICFTSAESSYGLGTVTNCIVEIPDGKNSLWMMKQNIETSDRRIKNLIATYIDISSSSTPKAYFLELDREQFESSGGLVAIPYKVPCVICHSSGPRVIRPTTASLGSLNSKQVELLTQWNEKIASYKVVETFKPKSKFAKLLEPQKKVFKERLRLSKCTGCH
ncbi:MAG: hypothetical protein NTV34_07215, partial [Proteobacteria bacterium]|nr:hypothetical protein [Pseudomonadota bacterium]